MLVEYRFSVEWLEWLDIVFHLEKSRGVAGSLRADSALWHHEWARSSLHSCSPPLPGSGY